MRRSIAASTVAVALVVFPTHLRAETGSARRIDDAVRVTRPGNVHPRTRAGVDLGRTDPALPMERVIVPLRIRADRRAALDRLLAEQQDPSSPGFHRWLTPVEFGARFGAASEDVAAVSQWLRSHGMVVEDVAKSGLWINCSGTAADVEAAFGTEMRDFLVDGELHHANAGDPSLPAALAEIADVPVSLHDFASRPAGRFLQSYTEMSNGAHWLSPADFATIYDVQPLHAAGINGSGQSVAVVARTNIVIDDVVWFRYQFHLPAYRPTIVLNGVDPGVVVPQQLEADLDVEWAGATAPYADIRVVVSKSTSATDGVDLSAQYAVDNNVAPVMTTSFGSCEATLGASKNAFYASLWAQAAAQGITSVVASGDSGAAGCDAPSGNAGTGLGVNGLASTPSNVSVGGTGFDDGENPGAYWSSRNDATTLASALSYIPESAWNESAVLASGEGLWATGGGASSLYAKPAWQAAPGVPADAARDVPDIALAAAAKNTYIVVSQRATHPDTYFGAAGTSAGTPAFAGVMALIAQLAGGPQGNVNPRLYAIAAAQYGAGGPAVFHDVVRGDNSVPGTAGYACAVGYDQATGLGSLDVTALAVNWFPGGGPDFALAAGPPSLTVLRSQWADAQVSLNLSGFFTGSVALSAAGLPDDMGVVFATQALGAGGPSSTRMTIVASDSTPPGTYAVTVSGLSGDRVRTCTMTVTVAAQPLLPAQSSLPPGAVGVPYAYRLGASGGAGGYSWSLHAGALPAGLEMNPDGTVSGVPAVSGDFWFELRVTDGSGASTVGDPGGIRIAANTCAGAWSEVNPVPTGGPLSGVVWAGTQFVAVGGGGTVLTSPDGAVWTAHKVPSLGSGRNMVWTGRQIVTPGPFMSSADAVHWTASNCSGTAVAWTGRLLVVVGGGGQIATSPDGVGWTPRYSGTNAWLSGVAWTGDHLVAVSSDGVLSSPDGQIWRKISSASVEGPVIWAGTRLVAAGRSGQMATSPDGVSWSFPSVGTMNGIGALTWTGTQIVAVGGQGTVLTSPDGATWTFGYSGARVYLGSVAWSGSQLVAVGGDAAAAILTSPDGAAWTSRVTGTTSDLTRVRWGGNRLLALAGSAVLTSSDGVTWAANPLAKGLQLTDVVWTGSQYVGVGPTVAMTSTDGVSWIPHSNGSVSMINGVTWTGTRLVAVGATTPSNSAAILTSPDGVTWTEQIIAAVPGLRAVCWTGSQLVAVGSGGPHASILTSPDGSVWTQRETTALGLTDVVWTGAQVVALGDAVLTSPDGVVWSSHAGGGAALAWTGSGLVSVGNGGAVSASPDGEAWTPQPSGTTRNLRSVAWTGSRLVAVGDGGTIVTSRCTGVCVPPAFTVAPQGATVERGHAARLSVSAAGTGPLFYQWTGQLGGGYGSTSWSQDGALVTPALAATSSYYVTVANACGSVASTWVVVTVVPNRPRLHVTGRR